MRRCGLILGLCLGLVLAIAGGAQPQSASDRKAGVDQRLERARDRLEGARSRESVLTGEVSAYSRRVRALESRIGPLRARARRLGAEHDVLRARLGVLTERLRIERLRLAAAREALARRRVLLADRVRELYVYDAPDPLALLLETGSLAAAVATADLLEQAADGDRDLVDSIAGFAAEVRVTRDRIDDTRGRVAVAEDRAGRAATAAEGAFAVLERQRLGLDAALGDRRRLLASVRGDRADIEEETRGLERRSQALEARIMSAQATSAPGGAVAVGAPSASGLVWPVNGPITSGYGPRWGRVHEGVDIAGGAGTPIGAAAAGTVIVAGYSGGYGNLVVVDHGNGLSTAYAHMQSVAVAVGQSVGQGTVVGGMGTTGNSTGVHLHVEVRVNGAAVDPIGYL